MGQGKDPLDPKGLIRESYRIEGIDGPQCRTIFLDWALSLPAEENQKQAIATLLLRYEAGHGDHPMTEVLREGLQQMNISRGRRGGWRAKARD